MKHHQTTPNIIISSIVVFLLLIATLAAHTCEAQSVVTPAPAPTAGGGEGGTPAPEPSVIYSPHTLSVTDLRARRNVITFIFPPQPNCGSMCLETVAAAGNFWNRWVYLTASVDSIENDQPYGWRSYGTDLLCADPDACIVQGNASNIVEVRLATAPDFDLYFEQTLSITFSGRLLPNLVATGKSFPVLIEPENLSAHPVAFAFSLVAVGVHVVTIALFPFSLDTAGLLLSVSPSCTRSDARNWLPFATYGALPLGGDTFGARLWRVGAFLLVAGLALAVWMTVSGTRATDVASARLQATVPLLLSQAALYFLPGVSFASGALISKSEPLLQVVGVSLVVILALVMLAVHSWTFRRSTWRYYVLPQPREPDEGTETFQDRMKRAMLPMHGFWLDGKEGEEQLNTSILPREVRSGGPDDPNHWVHALFWLGNVFTYTVSGLTADDVFGCVLQRSASATLWVLSAIAIFRIKPFRAGFLNMTSAWIRLFTALAIVMQAISPGVDKLAVFFTAAGCALSLQGVRLYFALRGFNAETKERVKAQLEIDKTEVDRMMKQRQVELDKARREEEAAARALEARMESKRRREMRRRGPMLVELGVGGDPVAFAAEAAINAEELKDNKSITELMVGDAVNLQGAEPRYLREASRFKPLTIGAGLSTTPSWFPAERPHARTTTEGDLPLTVRPYTVRKFGSYEDEDRFHGAGFVAGDYDGDDGGHQDYQQYAENENGKDDDGNDDAYSSPSSSSRAASNRFVDRRGGFGSDSLL